MAKNIDIATLKPVVGTLYPPPFAEPCRARERIRLGDAADLTQYGVNLLRLPPGAWSSAIGTPDRMSSCTSFQVKSSSSPTTAKKCSTPAMLQSGGYQWSLPARPF